MSTFFLSSMTPLTYGSTIFISYPNNPNLTLYSDGMVKSRVYLKNMSHVSEQNSFDRSLFQIYPLFVNSYKKEALKVKSRILESSGINDAKMKKTIEELKMKLTLEYKYNLEHFEKVKNSQIPFDQPIQLLHVVSNKFLACNFTEAEIDKESFKLELVDVPSEETAFKILPSYKHQKESDIDVLSGDTVFLVCGAYYMNKVAYIHCDHRDEENKEFGKESLLTNSERKNDEFLRNPMKEVNVSLEKSNRWAINLFCGHEEDKSLLFYGDVIWMNHAEQNATMIIRKQEQGHLEVDFIETILLDHFQQYIGSTNGMWIVENVDFMTGGAVHWKHTLRFKHFSSRQYLTIMYNSLRKEYEVKLEQEKTEEGLFQFIEVPNASSSQNYSRFITKEAFARIVHVATGYWFHVERANDKLQASLSEHPLDKDVFKIVKADNNEIAETNFLLSCLPLLKNYLSFLIGNARSKDKSQVKLREAEKNAKEVQECLVQLELFCTNRLLNISPDQKYGELNSFRQTVLREQGLLEMLCDILRRSFSEEEFESFLESMSKRVPQKRKRLLLTSSIANSDNKNTDFNTNFIMEEKVKVCRLVYQLLKSICENNPENELKIFKLFPQFQHHMKYMEEAVDCLGSIVQNNETILNTISEGVTISLVEKSLADIFEGDEDEEKKKKIKIKNLTLKVESNIKQDIDVFNLLVYFFSLIIRKTEKEKKRNLTYLNFLRKLCKCKGKGITANQELLFNVLNHFDVLKDSILMRFNITEEELVLEIAPDTGVALEECFEYIYHRKGVSRLVEVDYFKEQLGLFSDLLLGRNYLWKTPLESLFPRRFVFNQISNEKLSSEMRAMFCDLALTLHIDQEPLNPKTLPNLCRVFRKTQKDGQKGKETFRSSSDARNKREKIDQTDFSMLLENVLRMVNTEKVKLEVILKKNIRESKNSLLRLEQPDEVYVNNILLAKLVELLSKLIKVELLEILGKQELYSQIIQDLINILEYDQNNLYIFSALEEIRSKLEGKRFTLDKPERFQKSPIAIGVMGLAGIISKEIVSLGKDIAGEGDITEKVRIIRKDEDEDENALAYGKPLMKGLVLLRHQLSQLSSEQAINLFQENIIKAEICQLLDTMIDMRQDFLISNVLAWYNTLINQFTAPQKHEEDKNPTLESMIEEGLLTILPDIYRTGVLEIDLKLKSPEEKQGGFKGLYTKNKQGEHKSFFNYTGESETPDLDTLYIGPDAKKQELLGIVPSLLLGFYFTKDVEIEYKILKVLMRIFNQREELVSHLRQIEIIFEKEDVEVYTEITNWVSELKLLAEKSEVWLSEFLDSKGKDDQELMRVTYLLKDLQKAFCSKEKDSPAYSKSKQSIARNVNCHTAVIELIRNGVHVLKKVLTDKSFAEPKRKELLEMFVLSHGCLTKFCAENITNKQVLLDHLKLFLSNLDIEMDQIPLICEICRDYKPVFDEFGDIILSSLINSIFQYGRNPNFLEPILVFQNYKGEVAVDIQIKILNYFVPSNRALQENDLRVLYADLDVQTNEIEFTFKESLPLDVAYTYHSKLFDILVCNIKKNENLSFTLPRLHKIFPLAKMLNILLQPETFIPEVRSKKDIDILFTDMVPDDEDHPLLIRASHDNISSDGIGNVKCKVLDIIQALYLRGDKNSIHDFIANVETIEEFLSQENKKLLNLKDESLKGEECHYIFEYFVPFLRKYVLKVLNENPDDLDERRDNQLIGEYVHELSEMLPKIGDKPSLEQMRIFKELLDYYIDNTNNAGSRVMDNVNEILHIKQKMKEKHDERDLDASYRSEHSIRERRLSRNSDRTDDFANYSIFWQDFLMHLLDSKTLKEECKKENLALSEALGKLHTIFIEDQQKQSKVNVQSDYLIQKLINFLRHSLTSKVDRTTIISILQLLRNIIDNSPKKSEMQDFFDSKDSTNMLLSFFCNPNQAALDDDHLLNEFLSFGISLLDGGNQNVQRTIYNFCTAYQKSEVMFAKFHALIYEQINYLKLKASIRNEPQRLTELETQHKLKSLIIEKLLRFLQLFTEGHYLDLQNYLRYQTNSRNRYNLVEAVTELLRAYDLDLIQGNYDNFVKCLDTLTEFIQGPCPENQVEIINGKFFEIAVRLLTIEENETKHHEKKPQLQRRNRLHRSHSSAKLSKIGLKATDNMPLKPWMIARLQYKVVTLLNSLLEMRTSDAIVKRIMRSLPLETLKTSLTSIYKRYRDKYGPNLVMDAMDNFDGDPRDKDNKKPREDYEIIIETGFMIYFLIKSYSTIDTEDEDIDVKNELIEIHERSLAAEGTMRNLLENNVLSELGKFTYVFTKSGIDYLKDLKDKIKARIGRNRHQKKPSIKQKQSEERIKKALEQRQFNREAMEFFMRNSAHIEVARGENLERVDFMILPYCQHLPKETKEEFNNKVDRHSVKTKVDDLISASDEIIEICKHEFRLKNFFNRYKLLAIFANFVKLWRDLAFLLAILLNLFIFGSFVEAREGQDEIARLEQPILFQRPSISSEATIDTFTYAGLAQTICSLFVVTFFLLKRIPLIVKQAWKENDTTKKRSLARSIVLFIARIFKIIYYSLKSFPVLYYLCYGVFAVVGTIYHPFFFAFHLTDIFLRYPTIRDIANAVWRPKKQLGLTFLLFLIVTYIFSLFAFAAIPEQYDGDCNTTITCFLSTFDHMFKANGGIGGYLVKDSRATHVFRAGRFFFDNLANIILLIILINIFSGIIIDTFGSLREREQAKDEDTEQKCFICGLSKEVFDRQTDANYTYYIHIKKDHYMWNYVFYLAYLKNKDETEYTGIESYIHKKILDGDSTWMPLHKAIALENYEDDEDKKQREIKDTFLREVGETKQNVKEISKAYKSLTSANNMS